MIPPPPRRSVDEQLAEYARRFALCFAHPQGGHAKLDVIVPADGAVKLLGSWWIDDYDAFTRSLRHGEVVAVPMTTQRVRKALRRYLGTMLGWLPGHWSQVATEYRDIWTRAWPTKERFDAASS